MNGFGKWMAGLGASILVVIFSILATEWSQNANKKLDLLQETIKEQTKQIGDLQVRVVSMDTALEILLEGYNPGED